MLGLAGCTFVFFRFSVFPSAFALGVTWDLLFTPFFFGLNARLMKSLREVGEVRDGMGRIIMSKAIAKYHTIDYLQHN
jgi:hypothetical protein